MGKQAKKAVKKAPGKGRVKDLGVKNASKIKGGGSSVTTGWDLAKNTKL